jgi:cAMP-dependent protein kinase regulator
LRRGDYFGERALLRRVPRTATVVAVSAGRLLTYDRAAFRAFVANDLALRAQLEAALEYRAEVEEMPLFRDLSPTQLDLLLSRLEPVTVAPGEVVVRQGDPGDRFFVIRSGRLEVERDGRSLGTLGAGEAFGEIALLRGVPRTATVRALGPAALLALRAADFHDLLAGYCGRAGELERVGQVRLQATS